jgi:TonB family protein
MTLMAACATYVQHSAPFAACPPHPVPAEGTDLKIYDSIAVSQAPRRINGPPPVYPLEEKGAGISASVLVAVVIDASGYPETASVRVLAATDSAFAFSAAEAVRQSCFSPGTLNGRPVRVRMVIPVKYGVTIQR